MAGNRSETYRVENNGAEEHPRKQTLAQILSGQKMSVEDSPMFVNNDNAILGARDSEAVSTTVVISSFLKGEATPNKHGGNKKKVRRGWFSRKIEQTTDVTSVASNQPENNTQTSQAIPETTLFQRQVHVVSREEDLPVSTAVRVADRNRQSHGQQLSRPTDPPTLSYEERVKMVKPGHRVEPTMERSKPKQKSIWEWLLLKREPTFSKEEWKEVCDFVKKCPGGADFSWVTNREIMEAFERDSEVRKQYIRESNAMLAELERNLQQKLEQERRDNTIERNRTKMNNHIRLLIKIANDAEGILEAMGLTDHMEYRRLRLETCAKKHAYYDSNGWGVHTNHKMNYPDSGGGGC